MILDDENTEMGMVHICRRPVGDSEEVWAEWGERTFRFDPILPITNDQIVFCVQTVLLLERPIRDFQEQWGMKEDERSNPIE